MAEISVKQAIAAGWASRATIYRAVSEGKLSMIKTPDGRSMLDPSELIRVFGEPRLKNQKDETKHDDARLPQSLTEAAVLRERVESLERERERLERHVSEALEREAWLRQQLDKQTALLTTTAETGRSGFFSRLWGRKS
jgi:hypothetical protein